MRQHPQLPDLTGAELYVFEAEARAHGTAQERDAVLAELVRRGAFLVTPQATAGSPSR